MELASTFPSRFGSFKYELFPCDQYYMYNFVSVEDSNSRPLEQGMRGLFIEEIESGNVEGWVLDASTWTFNTFEIP